MEGRKSWSSLFSPRRLAVTENSGVISVFRSGEHNHPIQQISNCVY
jgi:hypothetical protein